MGELKERIMEKGIDYILVEGYYISDLNEQIEERLDIIMEQIKSAEGVTEELKIKNQGKWFNTNLYLLGKYTPLSGNLNF